MQIHHTTSRLSIASHMEKDENKTVNENIETRALTLNYRVITLLLLLLSLFFFITKGTS